MMVEPEPSGRSTGERGNGDIHLAGFSFVTAEREREAQQLAYII